MTVRRPNLSRERRYRSFAARAGDRSDCRRLAREEFRRDRGKGAPRISDSHKRNSGRQRRCRRSLGDDRDRACGDCRIDETRAVGFAAGDGDEHIATLYRAAVRGHSAHFGVGVTHIDFCVSGRNLAKLHVKLLISFPAARLTMLPYLLSFTEASISWSAPGRPGRGAIPSSGAIRATTVPPVGTAFQPDVVKPWVSGVACGSSSMIKSK